MKEYKFRAWRNGEMLYQEQEGTAYAAALFNRIHSDHPVMQFTGFQDSSGIDLYDGDLLSLSETNCTYEIRWENGAWVCYHWNNDYGRWGPLSRLFDPDFSKYYINRIGNIHQNPKP